MIKEEFKQTWWDSNLNSKMDVFKNWIGGYDAESKKFLRKYIQEKKYSSIADFGCGVATEFFGYKNDGYDIKYMGIDSSKILYDLNVSKNIPMTLSDVTKVPLEDNEYEVSFSRHVWEHQPSFKNSVDEMIRIASKEAIHIFFIKPDTEKIDYNESENLFHNRYDKKEIETYCLKNEKVISVRWEDINNQECVLYIDIKN